MRDRFQPSSAAKSGVTGRSCAVAIVLGLFQAPLASTLLAAEQADSRLIEEVVVTSRRREESVQDVPLSVTAFGMEAIEQLQPRTLRDFDGIAPNVYIGMNTAGPGASALFIRGVGYADIEKTNTPQVGVIVDGIQIGSSTGQLIDVFDVESIEVNRGPQGVLFGRNTIGGNIVVNRVKPQFNDLGVNVSAEAGNFDFRNLKGRVNIPLIEDTLALKIGAINRQRDGYYDNITLGGSAGDIDFSSQTASLRWQPADTFDAILTYDRINDDSQTMPQDPRFNGDDPFTNEADKREPTEFDVDQIGLRMDWEITDAVTLHSITGLHLSEDRVNQDFDGASLGGLAVPFAQLHTLREQEFDVFTQELRADWAVNEKLDLLFGMYYYESELEFQQRTNNVLQLPPVAIGLPDGTPCGAVGFRANPTVGDALCQFPNGRSLQIAGEDVESLAFFGSVTFRPTEQLELSLGLRYLDEDKEFFNSYFDYSDGTYDTVGTDQEFNFINTLPATPGAVVPRTSDSWDDTLITASANWAFSDNARAYFSYSEGFRSGGFSIRSADPNTVTFQPEDAEQFEIGIKSDLFDRRLRANVALFQLNRGDSQFNSIINLPPGSIPGTTTVVNNGGDQTIQGIEAELSYSINENFTVTLNGGFMDFDEEEFALPCDVIDGCQTAVPGVLDPLGTPRVFPEDDTSRQPEFNIATSVIYTKQFGPGLLTANVQYKENGDFIIVETGSTARTRVVEEGYHDVSASISWEQTLNSGDILKFTLWGKNLTDQEWREQALLLGPNLATGFQGWGAPRTYAFEVQWSR